jgi:lysozyme family protein
MRKVLGFMSKLVSGLFSIAVLALLMTLTYQALQRIFPNSFSNQIWGLVMFDIAAMCWALIFVFQSRSVGQYAAAGIGFLVAFLGTLLMVASEVILSGQNLAQIDTGEIGRWMIYGFIIVTALHAMLVYIHHGTAPEIAEQINVGIARGEVVTQAIENATRTIEAEKQELSQAIYNDIVSQVKRDLGMAPVDGTVFDRRKTYQSETAPLPVTWATQEGATQQDRPLSRQAGLPFFQTFKDWVSDLRKRTATMPTPAPTPAPETSKEASDTDWEIVNQKLEEVKQDLLRARDMLLPHYHPVPLEPQPAPEAPPNPPEQSQ